jgi:hypothetical protein
LTARAGFSDDETDVRIPPSGSSLHSDFSVPV